MQAYLHRRQQVFGPVRSCGSANGVQVPTKPACAEVDGHFSLVWAERGGLALAKSLMPRGSAASLLAR
jgi:hypothetical protein